MSGRQLTLQQRYRIDALNATGHTQVASALSIGVSPSTVCRELKRNGATPDLWRFRRYDAAQAHRQARERRHRLEPRIPLAVWEEVIRLLREERWSPEECSSRLRLEQGVHISHETIYAMLLRDKAHGGMLFKLLPHSGKRRKRYGSTETRGAHPQLRGHCPAPAGGG